MKAFTSASAASIGLLATASLLAPQPAKAADSTNDYSFVFGSVSGVISGLVSNAVTNVETITITNAPANSNATGVYTRVFGSGFAVNSSNIVVFTEWQGQKRTVGDLQFLDFYTDENTKTNFGRASFFPPPPVISNVTFRLEPIPGPLPLFGTAVAFGFSRKLRKRIQGSNRAVSTPPAA